MTDAFDESLRFMKPFNIHSWPAFLLLEERTGEDLKEESEVSLLLLCETEWEGMARYQSLRRISANISTAPPCRRNRADFECLLLPCGLFSGILYVSLLLVVSKCSLKTLDWRMRELFWKI